MAFFEALAQRIQAAGHEFVLVSGQPSGEQSARRDEAELSFATHITLPTRSRTVAGIQLRYLGAQNVWRDADVVVVELAAGSLDTWRALFPGRDKKVAVWGHVGGYVKRDGRAARLLKQWQVRRADHVFAYTASGAETALAFGASASRVTALGNTLDTASLRRDVLSAQQVSSEQARRELHVGNGPIFATIGGLDSTKRIDMIADSLDRLWSEGSPVQLLVGGAGSQSALLDRAAARGQVQMLGYVGNHEKALMSRVAIALVNPGRVGLIAVESMAMELPILTTTPFAHGPEYEYLRPGIDAIEVRPSAQALADSISDIAQDAELRGRLTRAIGSRVGEYPMSHMVQNMYEGLIALLED